MKYMRCITGTNDEIQLLIQKRYRAGFQGLFNVIGVFRREKSPVTEQERIGKIKTVEILPHFFAQPNIHYRLLLSLLAELANPGFSINSV